MFNDTIVCCYLYFISKYGYPPPAKDTHDYLIEAKSLGFTSIELEGIRSDHLLTVFSQRHSIREQLDELGLSCPYFCVVLPGLASSDEKERNENLSLFEKGCDVAAALGAKGVLDNGPLPPFQFPEDIPIVRHYDQAILRSAHYPNELVWDRYWAALIDTYRAACDLAASRDLTFSLHPCLGVLTATTDGYLYFHDAVSRDNLRFTFDTANLFVVKENLPLSLHRLAGLVDFIHLSDNRGDRIEHLPPGEGAIEWKAFFEAIEAIGFKGDIGLDIGGEESGIEDLESAYQSTARWLKQQWETP
ncbi:MAG: sugar phosphate isomerase/epimerase [Fidelibacterota bacterium]|nr:MAG: sugar phosphate isomerase/epimerase [Candidatus Neomarinimicrobiota bacterium]